MDFRHLNEAYKAVYDQELQEQLEEETLSFVDELTDTQLDIVVEEVVDELIEEGFDFDQVQEIFEEVIGDELDILEEIELVSEYLQESGLNEHGAYQVLNNPVYFDIVDALFEEETLTEARAAKRRTGGPSVEEVKAKIDAREAAKAAAKKKPTVKAKVTTVKAAQPKAEPKSDNVKDTTATSAWLKSRREKRASQKQKAEIKAGEAKAKERAKNIAGIRKEKEAAVAAKGAEAQRRARNIRNIRVGKAVRKGIAQAQVGAYNKAREIGQAASDLKAKATQSAKNKMAVAKRGIKGAIGKVAGKVASGAAKVASKAAGVAKKMSEEVDLYDVILSYLISEGYADTEDAAVKIMANMSEEWRQSIIEG
jgi:hypothetical protein